MLLLLWTIATILLAILWRLFVRGYVINWIGAAKALPGIVFDVVQQIGLSIWDAFGFLRHSKRMANKRGDEHDIYE